MDFKDTAEEASFRQEARTWIAENAPTYLLPYLEQSGFEDTNTGPYDFLEESKKWQKAKQEAGWACLHWPVEFGGRNLEAIKRVIWAQEEGIYTLLARPFLIGQGMCAPALMEYANNTQKEQFLPRLASGEDIWCQLFSEPASGSDLAGMQTRAVREDGNWRVRGQKIWTSGAHYSQYGLLLARSNPELAKHKGITAFFVDMATAGISIVPIKQASGASEFNEVYFDNVVIPDENRLGEIDGGWNVALTMLMNERLAIGGAAYTGLYEFINAAKKVPYKDGYAIDNPAIRSRLAQSYAKTMGLKNVATRTISALSRGATPGPESSISKLVSAQLMQDIAKLGLEIQGNAGLVLDEELAFDSAKLQKLLLRSPAVHIEGGTDQILRNIIGERVLGLPEEIRADKNRPFREIPTSSER